MNTEFALPGAPELVGHYPDEQVLANGSTYHNKSTWCPRLAWPVSSQRGRKVCISAPAYQQGNRDG